MDNITVGYLGFVVLIVLIFLGVRIFIAAGLVGFLGLLYMKNWKVAAGVAGMAPHSEVSNFTLSVLPMFYPDWLLCSPWWDGEGCLPLCKGLAWLAARRSGLLVLYFATASFGAVLRC